MKVLLLGGTSFFGIDIAKSLSSEGHDVTLFTRGNRNPAELSHLKLIKGDRRKIEDLERANQEVKPDCVVDNIGYTERDVEIVLEACPQIKRYLFTSTVSVYRFRRDPHSPIVEDSVDFDYKPEKEDPKDVHWSYARGKLDGERVLRKQEKIAWTIVRPPVVYGPNDVSDRGFWYLSRILKGGSLIVPDGGTHSFRLVYSVDTANAYPQILATDKTIEKTYNVAQHEVITFRDFILDSARFLRKSVDLVSIPNEFVGELAGPYNGMVNFIPDDSQARRDFQFQSTPWHHFCRETAEWFVNFWKGDLEALLRTRKKELDLIQRWKQLTAKLSG